LSRDFDVLFIGDMYYDDVIGERVTRLVRQFVTESNPGQKIALVGDPGSISNPLYTYLSFVYLLLGTPEL
jgi:hypothetical protein